MPDEPSASIRPQSPELPPDPVRGELGRVTASEPPSPRVPGWAVPALWAVVMEAYVHGVSTRQVDDLVAVLA